MKERLKKVGKKALASGASLGTALTAMASVQSCSANAANAEGFGAIFLIWIGAMIAGTCISFVLFFLSSFRRGE